MVALVLLLLALAGCQAVHEGPVIDPVAISTPSPVAPPPAPVPALALPPDLPGAFTAWRPPRTLPSGERIEGHWVSIPLRAPAAETMEPARPIPRAPRLPTAQKLPAGQGNGTPSRQAFPLERGTGPGLAPTPPLPQGTFPGLPSGALPQGVPALPGLSPYGGR